jgi:hypothetical protein
MIEERRRREESERERDELRQELYVLRRPPEATETVEEDPDRAGSRSGAAGTQESALRHAGRPWWRRMFGR